MPVPRKRHHRPKHGEQSTCSASGSPAIRNAGDSNTGHTQSHTGGHGRPGPPMAPRQAEPVSRQVTGVVRSKLATCRTAGSVPWWCSSRGRGPRDDLDVGVAAPGSQPGHRRHQPPTTITTSACPPRTATSRRHGVTRSRHERPRPGVPALNTRPPGYRRRPRTSDRRRGASCGRSGGERRGSRVHLPS